MAVSPHDATHINAELAHHVGGRNCRLESGSFVITCVQTAW
jgi:hypothetical protein